MPVWRCAPTLVVRVRREGDPPRVAIRFYAGVPYDEPGVTFDGARAVETIAVIIAAAGDSGAAENDDGRGDDAQNELVGFHESGLLAYANG